MIHMYIIYSNMFIRIISVMRNAAHQCELDNNIQ